MANERIIHIGTEFDASSVLKGINEIRQELGGIHIDSRLFKDVEKDLDKISKIAIEVSSALKNGIPEKGINSFLNQTKKASELYSTLSDKIRQVSINTSNIQFSPDTVRRLEQIELEIDDLGEKARKVLGEDLKRELKQLVPDKVIDDKALKGIVEAENRTEAFQKELEAYRKKDYD